MKYLLKLNNLIDLLYTNFPFQLLIFIYYSKYLLQKILIY
jgi:hypothetical protein